jgi:hypothetical protein
MNKFFLLSLLLFLSPLHADNDVTISGEIKALYAYEGSTAIYFQLNNQPESHPECDASKFVINTNLTEPIKADMTTKIFNAYNSKSPLTIGYDGQGNCTEGYISANKIN